MIIARLLCDYCVIQLSCDRTNSLTPCKSTGKSSASFGIEREGLLRNPYKHPMPAKQKNLLAQVNLDRQVSCFLCGKRGIRTPGPSQVNGFQDRRDRPLRHLSLIGTKSVILPFCPKKHAKVSYFFEKYKFIFSFFAYLRKFMYLCKVIFE